MLCFRYILLFVIIMLVLLCIYVMTARTMSFNHLPSMFTLNFVCLVYFRCSYGHHFFALLHQNLHMSILQRPYFKFLISLWCSSVYSEACLHLSVVLAFTCLGDKLSIISLFTVVIGIKISQRSRNMNPFVHTAVVSSLRNMAFPNSKNSLTVYYYWQIFATSLTTFSCFLKLNLLVCSQAYICFLHLVKGLYFWIIQIVYDPFS